MDSITIFHTGFIICLAGSILFFVISVLLFFLFDIRTIFAIRSGRAQAKTVKEMQEANSSTGRLRIGKATQTSSLKKKTSAKPPVKSPISAAAPVPHTAETALPVTEEVLMTTESSDGGFGETEALADVKSETTVLSSELSAAPDESSADQRDIHFVIVKKIVCRDTEEIVY